ncbi:hypothetical protein V6Z12_D11G211800 [Gossypium hirsutum]
MGFFSFFNKNFYKGKRFFSPTINYLTSKGHNLYLPLVLGLDKVNPRLCLKLKNLEHRALILNSKGGWTKCSWG